MGTEKGDHQIFDRLLDKARLHVEAGVNASKPCVFETTLTSMLLEQEKSLVELRSKTQ